MRFQLLIFFATSCVFNASATASTGLAPDKVDWATFSIQVTDSNFPWAIGTFVVPYSAQDFSSGTYVWQKLESNVAEVSYIDDGDGISGAVRLNFSTATSGTFRDDFTGSMTGFISGTFSIVEWSPVFYGPSSWFADSTDLGEGWRWLPWLGFFNVSSAPWVFHQQHGWLYPFGTDPEAGMYFWDAGQQSFLYTRSTLYPTMFRFSDQKWVWYQRGSRNPRWFVDLVSGEWKAVE